MPAIWQQYRHTPRIWGDDLAPDPEPSPPPPFELNGFDFAEWQLQVLAVLTYHRLDFFRVEDGVRKRVKQMAAERTFEVAYRMRPFVSPYLLARVPAKDRWNGTSLPGYLEDLCRPFRLFDLPLELRQLIYAETFPEPDASDEINLLKLSKDRLVAAVPLPVLSQVSRQIRHEFLEFYFSNRTMCLWINDDWMRCEPATTFRWNKEFNKLLRAWAENVAIGFSRFLRSLIVRLPSTDLVMNTYQLHFSRVRGLQISTIDFYGLSMEHVLVDKTEYNAWIANRTQDLEILERHITKVDDDRKLLGLQGESMIMALMQNKNGEGEHIWIARE